VRLFVGVELGEEIVANLGLLIDRLRERAQAAAPEARVTWVAAERLHATVRFIGNADDQGTLGVKLAFEAPLAVKPFDLEVAGIGTFPKGGPPRVIWAGVSRGSSGLQEMERELSDRLKGLGIAREERDYSPHITLARVRHPAGLRASHLLDGLGESRCGAIRVRTATLFESRLSPKGPTYVPLQRIPLGA
jgi:2'-5' RNA ligase